MSTPAIPLVITLENLTAPILIANYPPPTPLVLPLIPAGTSPGAPNYEMILNEQSLWHYGVDVPNQYQLENYQNRVNAWEMGTTVNGTNTPKQLPLPNPPAYNYFDTNAYAQWWAQYSANMGNVPPYYFIKPFPLPLPPLIIPDGSQPPPAVPSYDGPVGQPVTNNPGVFSSSSLDGPQYPDGYIYSGSTGVYQKHQYANPFTVGQTRTIWVLLS